MNLIARLITTALIAALAFVAVPATAANAEECGVLNCSTPPECTLLSCPNPPAPPCTLLSCPSPRATECQVADVSVIDDLTAEVSTLRTQLVAKDARITKDAVRIDRLRAKVQQLRERLRSR